MLQFVHLDEDSYCVCCRHSKCVSDHRKHVLFLAMSGLSHIKAQAVETALHVKTSANKPNGLHFIPRTHIEEGENARCPLTSTHVPWVYVQHMCTQNKSKCENNFKCAPPLHCKWLLKWMVGRCCLGIAAGRRGKCLEQV